MALLFLVGMPPPLPTPHHHQKKKKKERKKKETKTFFFFRFGFFDKIHLQESSKLRVVGFVLKTYSGILKC